MDGIFPLTMHMCSLSWNASTYSSAACRPWLPAWRVASMVKACNLTEVWGIQQVAICCSRCGPFFAVFMCACVRACMPTGARAHFISSPAQFHPSNHLSFHLMSTRLCSCVCVVCMCACVRAAHACVHKCTVPHTCMHGHACTYNCMKLLIND